MSIASFLPREAVERVNRPDGEATGLPAIVYTDKEFFTYEQKYIFAQNWTFAATLDELDKPGTAIPVTVAGLPIVIVKDRKGHIRSFHNACSHRGTKIVAEPRCGISMLVCPYHSWGYALDGALKHTPNIGGHGINSHPGIQKSEHGLRAVRCETWHRLVFVNLSNDGPSLSEYLEPLVARWPLDYSRLRLGGFQQYEFKANWKLVIENFLESYHLPWVHPALNTYSKAQDHYNIFVDPCGSGQATRKFAPGPVNGKVLPSFPDVPPHLEGRGEYLNLFPNLMIGTHPTEFIALSVEPLAPDLTRERFYVFYTEEGMSETYEEARKESLKRWFQINAEDIDVVQRMQEGRMSPVMAKGNLFAPGLEACLQHFQKQIVTKIFEGERRAGAAQRETSIAAE